jgi:trans-aconitate 2-methyltransferase
MADWSPSQYLKFAGERARPAIDLLNAIPLADPHVIVDLGCGPGNSTALLAARYPYAAITGIDNSPAMIAEAKTALPAAHFEVADIAQWQMPHDADLVFSNAAFQWLKGHDVLMLRLLKGMKAGSILALQMPNNLHEPSHALMRKVAALPQWRDRLKHAGAARETILDPMAYYRLLKPHGASVDIWQTTYHHPLKSHRAIVELVSSTGLRPYLDPLTEGQQAEFRSAYEEELCGAYPAKEDGTVLLAFPRIFIAAMK